MEDHPFSNKNTVELYKTTNTHLATFPSKLTFASRGLFPTNRCKQYVYIQYYGFSNVNKSFYTAKLMATTVYTLLIFQANVFLTKPQRAFT